MFAWGPFLSQLCALPLASPKFPWKALPASDCLSVLQVRRRSTGRVLFSTDLPGLILSDQFLQVPAKLASKNVYGLGENLQRTYRHDLTKWKTWVGYARYVTHCIETTLPLHPKWGETLRRDLHVVLVDAPAKKVTAKSGSPG